MGTWVTPDQVQSGFFNNLDLYADALDYFDSVKVHSRLSQMVRNVRNARPDQQAKASYVNELEALHEQLSAVDPNYPSSVLKAIDMMISSSPSNAPNTSSWHGMELELDTNLDFLIPSNLSPSVASPSQRQSQLGVVAQPRSKHNSSSNQRFDSNRPSITNSSAQLWLDALDWNDDSFAVAAAAAASKETISSNNTRNKYTKSQALYEQQKKNSMLRRDLNSLFEDGDSDADICFSII